MTNAYVIARARIVAKAARANQPLHGCPYTDPDMVRAFTLGAAAEVLDSLAFRLEQATTDTPEEETTP